MVGSPERESLHNFSPSSRLRWGQQRQFRSFRPTQSSISRRVPASANALSQQSKSPATGLRHSPTIPVFSPLVSPPRADKERFAIISITSDGETEELETMRQQQMSDLQVSVDGMKLGSQEEEGKDKEEKKPVKDALPWNLRYRRGTNKTLNDGASDKREAAGGTEPESNRFSLALSESEVESDFLAMTGAKPPRRPMKRYKPIQKKIEGLFPGAWLSEVSADRYKVCEMPERKDK